MQAITNTFLDLFHSPDAPAFVAELRKECDRVLAAHNGEWTKAALNELVLVDSAIKESMRLSVRVIGMHRLVSRSPTLHSTAIDLAPGDCPKWSRLRWLPHTQGRESRRAKPLHPARPRHLPRSRKIQRFPIRHARWSRQSRGVPTAKAEQSVNAE